MAYRTQAPAGWIGKDRPILAPTQLMHEKTELLAGISHQRDQAFHTDRFNQVAQGNKIIYQLLDVTYALSISFKKGLEGGFLQSSKVDRILSRPGHAGAEEVAYLHRHISLFDELLQSIDPQFRKVRELMTLTKPDEIRAAEPELRQALKEMQERYASYRGRLNELIRRESPELLKIRGVDNDEPGFPVLVRILAGITAFSAALDRV